MNQRLNDIEIQVKLLQLKARLTKGRRTPHFEAMVQHYFLVLIVCIGADDKHLFYRY